MKFFRSLAKFLKSIFNKKRNNRAKIKSDSSIETLAKQDELTEIDEYEGFPIGI